MFDERKHPRDTDGKFTDGNGGNDRADKLATAVKKYSDTPKEDLETQGIRTSETENIDELLGEEFKGVKGQAAVDKLLKEKRGHVKGAFYREDIGDIDLFWGNEYVGLRHIIEERQKEKVGHVDEALAHLETAIKKADFDKINDRGNLQFIYKEDENKFFVIIAPEYHKKKLTYVVTTFKRSSKRPKN